jgi:wobble nucleotide-excising tRNase
MVFADYNWDKRLPLFKRFNLIYGWNGSGKTTLTWLFDALAGSTFYPGLEYDIEDDKCNMYRHGDTFYKKVRVFNQDYIKRNVKLLEGKTNSITVSLGEVNRDLIELIENDEQNLNGVQGNSSKPGKISLLNQYEKDNARVQKERSEKFTDIAKTIGAAIGGNALRNYRKPQAEADYAALSGKILISDEELNICLLSVKQESQSIISPIEFNYVAIQNDNEDTNLGEILTSLIREAGDLLNQTVKVAVIKRLTENKDISDWVEQGTLLHKKHNSELCEYCLQKIPILRLNQLAEYFNAADKLLKENIDKLIHKFNSISSDISSLEIPDEARFYKELQAEYINFRSQFIDAQTGLIGKIGQLVEELKYKKSKTTETIVSTINIDATEFLQIVDFINNIIKMHNQKTMDFNSVKAESETKLKKHYLSTINDNVNSLNKKSELFQEKIKNLKYGNLAIPGDIGIEGLQKRISDNKAKISSSHKACEQINRLLAIFLGRKELYFIPSPETQDNESTIGSEIKGEYLIMRGNERAYNLSEGEKTAIAFVYFVVHLTDRDFSINDGIIIIDDPISSLDSNSLYQAFSVMKNAVKDGYQVFIFTHNFEFLRLLINWRKFKGHAKTTGYYMIKNNYINNVRYATIDMMDKELYEYESEYHYLFKLLKKMREEQDGTIEKSYPVPHIARKVLDTFLTFRVPNGTSQYSKIEELKKNKCFDEQKLDSIYKFANDQLHITGAGFDPSLVPETKKNVEYILEMIETVFPEHYKILNEATCN